MPTLGSLARPAALLALLAVIGACTTGTNNPPPNPTTAATTQPTIATSSSTPTPTPTATTVAAAPGEQVTVADVIDGDTFTLADGRKVRVLGIDSCEMSTNGGRDARVIAEANLQSSSTITLSTEPGVDKDRYGRLLRYVTLADGKDFGEEMVQYDHTGVYQGRNDASPEYVQRMYAADLKLAANPPVGRDCGGPYRAPASTSSGSSHDDGGDINLPDGALTGGYCARKWWC